MRDHQRYNKYTSLYLGPVKPRSTPALREKSMRDRAAFAFGKSPPEIYAVTNIQSRPPLSMHMPVQRHREPTLLFDASTRFRETQKRNRDYYVGGSLFNQQIQRHIAELSKIR